MKPAILLLFPILLFLSCGKDDKPVTTPTDLGKPYTLPASSAANSAYDASNQGIYKGVTINALDSSATFQFNIANNGQTNVYCLEYMDSVLRDSLIRYRIDSTTYQPYFPFQKDISPVPSGRYFTVFESYYSVFNMGNAIVPFAVEGDGTAPNISGITLNNNQTLDAILKEKSDNQVYCFEGTWEGSYYIPNNPNARDYGTVAFTVRADTAVLIMASQGHGQFFPASGAAISGGQFTITIPDNPSGTAYIYTCAVSGNTCSGTWTKPGTGDTGTFTAHRTL